MKSEQSFVTSTDFEEEWFHSWEKNLIVDITVIW